METPQIIGLDPQVDVVLPERETLRGIARYQVAIYLSDLGQVVVEDLQKPGEPGGTAVKYGDNDYEKLRGVTWIVSGHGFPPTLVLHDDLKFSLVCQNQGRGLVAGAASSEDNFGFVTLGIQSWDTSLAPSGIHTPGTSYQGLLQVRYSIQPAVTIVI